MDVSTVAANDIPDDISLSMKAVLKDRDFHVSKFVSRKCYIHFK